MKRFLIIGLLLCSTFDLWAQQSTSSEGISIDFTWQKIGDKQAHYEFYIRDSAGAAAVLGAYPAAWVHPTDSINKSPLECQKQAETFIGGSLFSRADIDLNQYYVVTMNDDASLSVVDPLFGFGGSKLLNRIILPSVAYDWALTEKGRYLWMSFPESGEIGRLDTGTWQLQTLPVLGQPQQLILQNDQRYVWVALEKSVIAVDTENLGIVATVAMPDQPGELLSAGDSSHIYVSLPEYDHVALIDTATLRLVQSQKTTGKRPVSLAYSQLAQLLYVANHSGTVDVLSSNDLTPVTSLLSQQGLTQLRFEPSGRWGFMVNSQTDRLSIIDAASNRIVQTGLVESQPVSIDFSNDLVYIRHQNSSTLLMIALDDHEIGRAGAPIPVVDTPGGDYPPGLEASTTAAGIVKAPGANAVLVANPKDKTVYFYKEGMAAPMGQFGNYGQKPRAVLALDRSLRDSDGKGRYQTIAELPKKQRFHDVVFFMDSPRRIHCFTIDLGESDETGEQLANMSDTPQFTAVSQQSGYQAENTMELVFKSDQNELSSAVDVIVSTSSGLWRQRKQWTIDDQGELRITFIPPMAGLYQLQYMDGKDGKFRELGDKWYEVQ